MTRSDRHHILPACTIEGVLTAEVYTGYTDGEVFEQWFEHKLLPHCQPYPAPRSVVLMDNASFHHTEQIVELCNVAGVRLVYLPPYSPDFNPIEEYFGQLKMYIRREFELFEKGLFYDFTAFLEHCIQVTGYDSEAAKGHFNNCYIAV